MPSQQRRRGQTAILYKSKTITDARGNQQEIVDEDNPYEVKAAFPPQRSAKAELPGQMDIHITRMIVQADLPGVDSWSRVFWRGQWWDVVTPPAYRHGSRHVRHWSFDLKRRPG